MTTLVEKQKKVKEIMDDYRTNRNEKVRFLREEMGLTFSEIGQNFGVSKARIYQLYQEAWKEKHDREE